MYQRDAYLSVIAGLANESYKNIPLVHFSSGYALYINSTYRMRADVGVQAQDRFPLPYRIPMWICILGRYAGGKHGVVCAADRPAASPAPVGV